MTLPPEPPATVGLAPINAAEVNNTVGYLLRQFTDIKEGVGHHHQWLLPTVLTDPPYNFTPEQETLLKSAIADLDTGLDAIDMTFIERLTGLWT